jgi:hypothetical protein
MSSSHSEALSDLRLRLLANGYEPVPIIGPAEPVKSAGKRPRLSDWASIQITPAEVRRWGRDLARDTNTGIRCGALLGVDIDVPDAALARAVEDLAFALLGPTPLRRVGRAPKLLLAYQSLAAMAKAETPEFILPDGTKVQVEILAKGQQFVSHGTHPDTGHPYAWTAQAPENTPLAAVPAVEPARIRAFLAACEATFRDAGARTIKDVEAASRSAHTLPPRQAAPRAPEGGAGGFFREVNDRAFANLDAWVRRVFPAARWQPNAATPPGAWRVASADLGRGLEEDISIHTREGIQDFGTRESLTPIDLVIRWAGAPDAPAAARWLCETLGLDPAAMGWKARKKVETQRAEDRDNPGQAADVPTEGPATKAAPIKTPLPLEWFEDIKAQSDALDFVQGVLTEQGASVVYGESNCGKTFFATDLALCVAASRFWMGRRVEGGPVAYCVLEGGMGFRNRVHAWRAEHGMEDAQIPFVAIPASINLLNPEADTPRLIETLKRAEDRAGGKFRLIVVDTLSRAIAGGNENAPEDMGALVKNMDTIREHTGAHVLFIHHSGKDAAKGARGHSLLRAAVDTEIEVKADEEAGTREARVVKQRELPKGMTFPFALKVVEVGTNRHDEPVTSCIVEQANSQGDAPSNGRRLSGDARQAFEVLCDTVASDGQTGYAGVPGDALSIPEDWWRERFYQRAKPGASQEAKKKAFRRAADALLGMRMVAMNRGRVWLVKEAPNEPL